MRISGLIDMLIRSLLFGASCLALPDEYNERLLLRPVDKNMLLSEFSFNTTQSLALGASHYGLFPRSLGQILESSKTSELHLRFGHGWWDADFYGSYLRDGAYSGGIGIEVWGWVEGETREDAAANWKRLVNQLSGLFCASLNFIDESHTTYPSELIHRPAGFLGPQTWLMRGALPGEPVCTENLTPFIKLLPCKSHAGLASLLDGHRLFDTQWQSMAIDVFYPDSDSIQLLQTISLVADVPRLLEKRRTPIPLPTPDDELVCDTTRPTYNQWACLPKMRSDADWTLSDIFGHNLTGACPLATGGSVVEILASDNWNAQVYSIFNGVDESLYSSGAREFELQFDGSGKANLHDDKLVYDIKLSTSNTSLIEPLIPPPIRVERSITGRGQQEGGLRTVFSNPGTEDMTILYFESLPWYMKLYLHTLKITSTAAGQQDVLKDLHYQGAKDRERPTQLEFELIVPAGQSVVLSYEFDKSLLYIEEYPPDANHGFVIEPGLVVTRQGYSTRTTSLLLSLAVPDFSMVYNVIILSSTVMSFAFGNLYSCLTKSVVSEAMAEKVKATGKIAQVLSELRMLKGMIKGKLKRS